MKFLGEIYKKGNTNAVDTHSAPTVGIEPGLPVEITEGEVKAVDTGVAAGISGKTTNATIDVVRSGLEVAVQVVDAITIKDGEAVYIDATTKKFTNVSDSNTAVNAVFRSEAETMGIVQKAGVIERRGALIDFVGGL